MTSLTLGPHDKDEKQCMELGLRGPAVCRFQKRTRIYTALWCCVNAHPGHVWYDMWWDSQHTDRHNRRQNSTDWVPMLRP